MGGYHGQTHRRIAPRCRPLDRVHRFLGAGGRYLERPAPRARLPAALGRTRQRPSDGDRLFGQQQRGWDRSFTVGLAGGADSVAGSGGRTENLVEAVPDRAIRGVLRLTEQGEVVNQSYGLRPIAMRTLERTFASVALATAQAAERRPIPAAQMAAMQTIAARSLAAYRDLVFGSTQFFEYFRAATPLDVIERMHIGSRPAARAVGDGVHALRAIPWVFAWTQSRHMLPGWFGFGSGLQAAAEQHGAEVIGQMLAHWPFFGHLVDDVEAMLARTDLEIAGHYDALAG